MNTIHSLFDVKFIYYVFVIIFCVSWFSVDRSILLKHNLYLLIRLIETE